jgi:hypothetical protein
VADPGDDFLDLDMPENRHRTFGRLGLLVLGAGAALSLVSLLLTSMLAGGMLDLLVLILWLGSGSLGLAGLGLLGLAGFKALAR